MHTSTQKHSPLARIKQVVQLRTLMDKVRATAACSGTFYIEKRNPRNHNSRHSRSYLRVQRMSLRDHNFSLRPYHRLVQQAVSQALISQIRHGDQCWTSFWQWASLKTKSAKMRISSSNTLSRSKLLRELMGLLQLLQQIGTLHRPLRLAQHQDE